MPESVTVASLIDAGTKILQSASDISPRLEAEILLAHALGTSRTWLHTWPEKEAPQSRQDYYFSLLERRSQGEPVAYLTGRRNFWTMELEITPDTLIPRPETELLVELALEKIPGDAPWSVADLGTGSGAIALAIASERPHCKVTAVDTSKQALAVAKNNALRLEIKNALFVCGHWCQPLGDGQFDLIASNPPYVAASDPHLTEGDLPFEPSDALVAGNEGYADLEEIAKTARTHLKSGGYLLLEHGYQQSDKVRDLLHDLGYRQITRHRDTATHYRVVSACWPGNQHPSDP